MSVRTMHERLGADGKTEGAGVAVPIQLPIGSEAEFRGLVDLVKMEAIIYHDELGQEWDIEEIPADMKDIADEAHDHLLNVLSDYDDELAEDYLEGKEISSDRLQAVIRKATLDIAIFPVMCGSSFKNKGVQPLLDAVVAYLPSPLDVPPMEGTVPATKNSEETQEVRAPDDDGPFSALAFKVMSDPFVGKLTYFRVYSGTLESGGRILNSTNGKTERVGRILMMHANHREEEPTVYAGDIAAGVGFKQTVHGRHAVRTGRADPAGEHHLPGAGRARLHRAEDQVGPGEDGRRPRSPRRGGPDLPHPHRRGDRPDRDLRHGRAAPRGHRRPHEARVQR